MRLALSRGMSASREWEDGFERRSTRARRIYRRAQLRARRRADFWSEVVRYLIVVSLLLFFLRPIGVIVAICWGISLWSRYSRLELEPRLRDRWTATELGRERDRIRRSRDRRRQRRQQRHAPREFEEEPDEAERLLAHVGDDPASEDNLAQARRALASAEALGREHASAEDASAEDEPATQVRMAELLEDAIDDHRARMKRNAVALNAEFDSSGLLPGDPDKLRRIFRALIGSALDVFEDHDTPDPLIEIHMGENLARTQVWVRIRHNGPAPDADEISELTGSGIECDRGANDGYVLTFEKRPDGVRAARACQR